MITFTASLCLALILPGAPASENAPSLGAAPVMVATSSPTVLSDLAQFSGSVPVLAAPDAVLVKPVTPIKPVKRTETPVFFGSRSWLAMTALQHSAATVDAWSTRQSITSGRGHELNPLMKPFAGSGAIYGVIQVAPLATDYLGKRLMNSKHPTLRKLWWLPQAAGTAGFMLSSVNNLRVASR
jgi:hypothetical protein